MHRQVVFYALDFVESFIKKKRQKDIPKKILFTFFFLYLLISSVKAVIFLNNNINQILNIFYFTLLF